MTDSIKPEDRVAAVKQYDALVRQYGKDASSIVLALQRVAVANALEASRLRIAELKRRLAQYESEEDRLP